MAWPVASSTPRFGYLNLRRQIMGWEKGDHASLSLMKSKWVGLHSPWLSWKKCNKKN